MHRACTGMRDELSHKYACVCKIRGISNQTLQVYLERVGKHYRDGALQIVLGGVEAARTITPGG